ncbi:phosphoglycerate dehydrogenase [Phaeobacter sp. QD34_3]|uniref:phosphoglycerate dehydrogenase n=1 Tax=unclassified Phaeobacter TaxID=2621772 RepID=UPI00237F1DB3|nr:MULTISPECIES: phosphoglycerate dehydrogenase [unclassified Phaeobacter]MDE4134777.1 phosphoglycerate dehydrogenase [Phaeobacter sp. QD34_3]MDE4138435.1 phosphoglycerate dehydrogenase [Phaeobacter sp. QD34_24]
MKVLVSNIMMINERERFDQILRERGVTPIWPEVNQFMDEAQCLEFAGQVDGWLAGDDQITETVLKAFLPRLKVISKWGTGIDSIDLKAAKDLGVPVCNSPGAFRDAVSEYAIGLLLSATRRLARTDRMIRQGEWPKGRFPGMTGKTMGVVGYGAIGQGVGQRARGLGMEVIANDPFMAQTVDVAPDGAALVSFETLLEQADVICLCCNQTAENYHLINADTLARARDGVILCNVARGGLVDENALIAALNTGKVAAAALDVFEVEPLAPDHPLLSFENVSLSSHNANSTVQAIEYVHDNTLKNLWEHLGL